MPGTEQGSVKVADLMILSTVRHWLRDRDRSQASAQPSEEPAASGPGGEGTCSPQRGL